jgi:cell division control protein 6
VIFLHLYRLFEILVYLKVRGLSNSAILYKIIQNLDSKTKVPERGLDEYEYKEGMYRLLNAENKNLIIIFDEIDQLNNDNIVYDLSRAGADGEISDNQFINIIGLTNDLYYMDRMTAKTVSSFKPRRIPFNAYVPMELISILEDRKAAFKPDVLEEDVIPLCAAVSAKDNGDARKALWLLSNAGKLARRENAVRVTEDHVNKAREYFDTDLVGLVLKKLPFNVKTLLSVICCECDSGTRTNSVVVWKRYLEYCNQEKITPVSKSRVSQIITELRELGLLRTHETPGRRGGILREIEFIQQPDKVLEELNLK